MIDKKIQQKKVVGVESVVNELKDSTDVFFTEYRGLTVPQITTLRRELLKENTIFKISKNNLTKIAFSKAGKTNVPDDFFKGPLAIAYAKGQSGPAAKVLVNFSKENNKLVIKGGLVDNELYDNVKIITYGNLPTRLEILAMIAQATNGVASKLARVLQAVVEKKQAE